MLAEPPPPDPSRRRLTVDIDRGVTPLSGVIYADGIGQPFAGWLALASTIERLADPGGTVSAKDWGRVPGAKPGVGRDDTAGAQPDRVPAQDIE